MFFFSCFTASQFEPQTYPTRLAATFAKLLAPRDGRGCLPTVTWRFDRWRPRTAPSEMSARMAGGDGWVVLVVVAGGVWPLHPSLGPLGGGGISGRRILWPSDLSADYFDFRQKGESANRGFSLAWVACVVSSFLQPFCLWQLAAWADARNRGLCGCRVAQDQGLAGTCNFKVWSQAPHSSSQKCGPPDVVMQPMKGNSNCDGLWWPSWFYVVWQTLEAQHRVPELLDQLVQHLLLARAHFC